MALFNGKKNKTPEPSAPVKEEKPMADLYEAIKEVEEAAKEFLEHLAKLKAGSEEPGKGAKIVKRAKRASMTLTEELVDFRKNLP
jgi:hypothetical protein